MSDHTDLLMDAALRDLDPAGVSELDTEERARADALFARIVASPVPRARARPRWWVLAPVALAGAAGIAVPAFLLGGGSAFATWTPTPTPLTGPAAAAAAETCRANQESSAPLRTELVERRGGWTYVVLSGRGAEAICLIPDELVGAPNPEGRGMFGSYDSDTPPPPKLAPGRILERSSAEGSTDEGWFNWMEGYVGRDVTGVTVHTSSGLDVQASVVDGRMAAWWPGKVQSSSNPDGETWTYTVHLADGSSRETTCSTSLKDC